MVIHIPPDMIPRMDWNAEDKQAAWAFYRERLEQYFLIAGTPNEAKVTHILWRVALLPGPAHPPQVKYQVFCQNIHTTSHSFGVEYSANGMHPCPKIQGITEMTPPPIDKQQLASFIGMVTYMGNFVPHLSHHTEPLQAMLK